ncbi:phage holin family protein [Polaromonas sp.]|jgi:hypothetical protein|uniref:phage holin family protein n=1 Tax=Polaromonas sp. TaxID=1869339 RepID=UPI0037CAC739
MTRAILTLIFCMHLLLPATVWAQEVAKGPLNYSLKVYGGILAVALLGGLASWWGKVRKGELLMWNISALVGELCISAFAGRIALYLCDYMNLHQGLTAAIVGFPAMPAPRQSTGWRAWASASRKRS